MLKFNGRFYMVHRPFRLAEIFSTMMKYHIEPKRMRLVHPYADREPNMVLIEGLKGGKSRITIENLWLYTRHRMYTRMRYMRYTAISPRITEITGESYDRNTVSVRNSDRKFGGYYIPCAAHT